MFSIVILLLFSVIDTIIIVIIIVVIIVASIMRLITKPTNNLTLLEVFLQSFPAMVIITVNVDSMFANMMLMLLWLWLWNVLVSLSFSWSFVYIRFLPRAKPFRLGKKDCSPTKTPVVLVLPKTSTSGPTMTLQNRRAIGGISHH